MLCRKQVRLVFLSSVMTPQQTKLCAALNSGGMEAHFLFYEGPERTRGKFWRVEASQFSKVLPGTRRILGRYFNFGVIGHLKAIDPQIVMLGGFSIPGNYLAYVWAKLNRKRTVVFTERSRDSAGVLRRRTFVWRLLRWLYSGVDLVIVSFDDALAQFRDEFKFGDKVVVGRYAADIENYLVHPARGRSKSYRIIFPNRLTALYDPLLSIRIFAEFLKLQPGAQMVMNSRGELRRDCEALISDLGLAASVTFLDHIESWDQLGEIYASCDVMMLPASFSNGNFTILEAMASGMGIVISDRVLGIGNLIVDGENGFRCEPTIVEFLERLNRYVDDPGLFLHHMNRNREIVQPLGVPGTAAFLAEILERELLSKAVRS